MPSKSLLPLPQLLLDLSAEGRWKHPGDNVIHEIAPFFDGYPLHFLAITKSAVAPSASLMDLKETENHLFHEYRGSIIKQIRDLPWIDVDRAVLIAINKIPGDDTAIALDYRTSETDPRVIGSDWSKLSNDLQWREISATFSEFCRLIGFYR